MVLGCEKAHSQMGVQSLKKYSVSIFGRWKNRTSKGPYWPVRQEDKQYAKVRIKNQGRTRDVFFHQLVHILHNDPDLNKFFKGSTVDHGDRDAENNNAENLSWKSKSEQRNNQNKPKNDLDYSPPHDVEIEEWVGYGPTTQISSLGRIIRNNSSSSVRNGVPYFVRPRTDGYVCVGVDGKKWLMHRLVMDAFGVLPKNKDEIEVDHIDGNRDNNRLSNLQWVNRTKNNANIKKRKRAEGGIPVLYRIKGTEAWKNAFDARHAAELTGCNKVKINQVCNVNGNSKTSTGFEGKSYEFEYVVNDKDLPGEVWKEVDTKDWFPGGKYYGLYT